ncbi:MAG TPA: hypothetical protein VID47_13350 [Actinomycetota bacterium]
MSGGVRIALSIAGVLVSLAGAVFLLQGIGVLGGSFMSNTVTWTVIGAVMVAAGGVLLALARARPGSSSGRASPR